MTKRQHTILAWLTGYVGDRGYAPTLVEIGAAHGITKQTAREHVLALQRHGLVSYQPGMSRSAMPVDRCPACGSLLRCCEPAGD